MSDTIDLDIDLDNLDYGDFDDINPDDLDIDNLERELGLVTDTPKEEASTVNDKTVSNTSEPSLKEQSKDTSKDANAQDIASEKPSAAKIPSSPEKITTATTTTTTTSSKTEDSTTTSKPKVSSPTPSLARQHHQGTNGQQQYNPRMNRSKPPMNGQHHHPFNPGMMNINMMMMMQAARYPPHPGFPPGFPPGKAIHINPKFAAKRPDLFNNGPPTSAPVETNSMSLPTANPSQDALQRQREHILEQQRKRRERKAAEMNTGGSMDAGQKRKADSDNDRAPKRPFAIKGLGAKGISIKGAAAAAAAAVTAPPLSSPSSPNSSARSSAGAPASILSRINNHTRQQGQKRSAPDDLNKQHPKRPASNETVSSLQKQPATPSSPIPISTTGKSSKLVISNLSDAVTVKEIRALGQTVQGGIKDIDIDRDTQKATVTFNNAEAAVIFRRKYNRSLLGENHIQVSFATQ
ncbi:hypothetical protein K492DRAFT_172944 [Lichtheimia hyalospora FSU 10163]|nr:hypothetical protein K492DRAFT_172944 [Lichtheimia hyalospora FSU 10163]